MLDAFLAAIGIKKVLAVAGLVGGAISGGIMPGVLGALEGWWKRVLAGAASGAAIAAFAAEPLALALNRPDYVHGIALGLGLFGLSFVFKVLKAWNDFDVGGALGRVVDRLINSIGGGGSTRG